jgi:DNA polymerase I
MLVTAANLYQNARMDEVEREIVRMERNGFALDAAYCAAQALKAEEDETDTLAKLQEWLVLLGQGDREINWASPTQLVRLLHDDLGLPPSPIWKKGRVNTRAGERKLDEAALDWIRRREEIAVDVRAGIDLLIHLRRVRGALKYLRKLPTYIAPDGLVHAVSGPASDGDHRAGTITWRLASKNPEILQIPTDPKKDPYHIRKAFIAPPGYRLLCADETALEAVVFAHVLIRLYDDHTLSDLLAPGKDLHATNARRVFGEYLGWERYGKRVDHFPEACFKSDDYPELKALRQDIKAIWYGLMYGKSPYGFATSLRDAHDNPVGIKVAEAIVAALYAVLPAIPRYQATILDYILQYHGIPGLGGAWCDLAPFTKSGDEWQVKRAHRIAQNYPMQEGGARIIGSAMVDIVNDPYLRSSGLLLERQVHDELDFRVPFDADLARVKERVNHHMTSYPLDSLLQVEMGVGETWADC